MAPMPSTIVQKMTGPMSILIRPTNAVPSHFREVANSGKAKPTAMPAMTAPMTARYSQWVRSRFSVVAGCPTKKSEAMTAPGSRPAAGRLRHEVVLPADAVTVTFLWPVIAVTHSFIACTGHGAGPCWRDTSVVDVPAFLSHRRGDASLARRLLLLQALVVVVVVLTMTAVAYLEARQAVRQAAEEETTAIVAGLADSPL